MKIIRKLIGKFFTLHFNLTQPDMRSGGQRWMDDIRQQKTRGQYLREWLKKYGNAERGRGK